MPERPFYVVFWFEGFSSWLVQMHDRARPEQAQQLREQIGSV